MDTCEGYACPPEHSVPSQSVVVHQPTPNYLATTGTDPLISVGLIAALLIVVGLGLIMRARLHRA